MYYDHGSNFKNVECVILSVSGFVVTYLIAAQLLHIRISYEELSNGGYPDDRDGEDDEWNVDTKEWSY